MSNLLQAAIAVPVVILLIGLFVHYIESRPKRKARREAACEYERIRRSIIFCGTMSEIYWLQTLVENYNDTWKALIDYETLDYFTGSLYKALTERQCMLQAERNQRYSKTIYN